MLKFVIFNYALVLLAYNMKLKSLYFLYRKMSSLYHKLYQIFSKYLLTKNSSHFMTFSNNVIINQTYLFLRDNFLRPHKSDKKTVKN